MEDLLASIRKAIDSDEDEPGSSTASESRGTLMRGALRELRVNLSETKQRNREAREEIAELRGRILRSSQEPPPIPSPPRRAARPLLEPQRPPATARNDFKTILAGRQSQLQQMREQSPRIDRRAAQRQPEPPPIRTRTLQDEFDEITYGGPSIPAPPVVEPPYVPPFEQSYGPDYTEDTHFRAAPPPPEPRSFHPPATQQPMMSHHAEAVTEAAFRHLSESLFSQGMGGRSLEDVTRELLRGMLKQWLDDNLPPLVERLVREEIARVARNGR